MLLPVKAFCTEYHTWLTLMKSRCSDDRVMVATATNERGANDRRVLKPLVGPYRHVVIEVGAIARELKDEDPGLRLVGHRAQTALGLAAFRP
jgi:hypothetical protein